MGSRDTIKSGQGIEAWPTLDTLDLGSGDNTKESRKPASAVCIGKREGELCRA